MCKELQKHGVTPHTDTPSPVLILCFCYQVRTDGPHQCLVLYTLLTAQRSRVRERERERLQLTPSICTDVYNLYKMFPRSIQDFAKLKRHIKPSQTVRTVFFMTVEAVNC